MDMSGTAEETARGTGDALAALSPNPDWRSLPLFDRSTWTRVRFGDVVQNVNETERDPAGAGLDRFIGLEHLEPGSLHVSSWGNVADGTTFTRRCRPGQVLFGKRRAYQRKVAVAEFDAVVSGDIYVFAPKDGRLIPELLPFVCLSERFYEHAVGTSAGSLSPRTNWSSLAGFEFDLPPLEVQRRIAEVLWAVDEVFRNTSNLHRALEQVRTSTIEENLVENKTGNEVEPLGNHSDVAYGVALSGSRVALPVEKPYLRVANVLRDRLDLGEIKTLHCTPEEAVKFALEKDDVLLVEGHASVEEIGRSAIWCYERGEILHQNHLIRVRCGPNLLPDYLNIYVNSIQGRAYFRSHAKSSSGLNTINSTVVKEFPIPIIPVELQSDLISEIERIDFSINALVDYHAHLWNVSTELLNRMMS